MPQSEEPDITHIPLSATITPEARAAWAEYQLGLDRLLIADPRTTGDERAFHAFIQGRASVGPLACKLQHCPSGTGEIECYVCHLRVSTNLDLVVPKDPEKAWTNPAPTIEQIAYSVVRDADGDVVFDGNEQDMFLLYLKFYVPSVLARSLPRDYKATTPFFQVIWPGFKIQLDEALKNPESIPVAVQEVDFYKDDYVEAGIDVHGVRLIPTSVIMPIPRSLLSDRKALVSLTQDIIPEVYEVLTVNTQAWCMAKWGR